MIGDHYQGKFNQYPQPFQQYVQGISQQEFETLKKEVLEMKELLKKAKQYDEKHNEPNCETEEKIKLLREMAKAFGIDLDTLPKENK